MAWLEFGIDDEEDNKEKYPITEAQYVIKAENFLKKLGLKGKLKWLQNDTNKGIIRITIKK